jgi:uncharacterized protein
MQTHKINCGKTVLSLSVFDTGIPRYDGPTVVITAGVDGDEYTGIETAKQLIRKFSRESVLCGRVIIIPIVNVSGYTAKTSINPHDNVYPKHIYPGNRNGTESERIIAWLTSEYLDKAHVWIDLHGGDTHEKLKPFVWGYQTRVSKINERATQIVQATGAERTIYQKNFRWGKVEHLAKKGCAYVVFECGDSACVKSADVSMMQSWVVGSLHVLGMGKSQTLDVERTQMHCTEVHEYSAPKFGITWNPTVSAGQTVEKGQLLGTCTSAFGGIQQSVVSRQQGYILWHRICGTISSRDILVAIGR